MEVASKRSRKAAESIIFADFPSTSDEKYLCDRVAGLPEGEPIPNSPLAELFKVQRAFAARIFAWDGVHECVITMDEDVLIAGSTELPRRSR